MIARVTGIDAKYGPSTMLTVTLQIEQIASGRPRSMELDPHVIGAELTLDLVTLRKRLPDQPHRTIISLGRHDATMSSTPNRVVFDVNLGIVGVGEVDRLRDDEEDVWLQASVQAKFVWIDSSRTPQAYTSDYSQVIQDEKYPGQIKIPWSEWAKYKEVWRRHLLIVEFRDPQDIHDIEDVAEKYSVEPRDIVISAVKAYVAKEKGTDEKGT